MVGKETKGEITRQTFVGGEKEEWRNPDQLNTN
jgi:hypothetical protein